MRHSDVLRILAPLTAAVALLVACGDDAETTATAADATSSTTGAAEPTVDGPADDDTPEAPTDPAPAVPTALDFVLDDVTGGDQVEGADFAGEDLVVWFWAPWCTKCNKEAPTIAELSARRDDVRFLGMAGLDARGAAADFVARHDLDGFPHAYDEDGDTWQAFGITSQSSFAFIDDDGSVEIVDYSVLGGDELERRIDELVAA